MSNDATKLLAIIAYAGSETPGGEVWFVGEARQIQRFFPWEAP